MADISWPTSLPQILILDGLTANKEYATVRTQMDAGPVKQRRRYTVATKTFTGSMIVTETQRQVLESFYEDTLKGGALRFNMSDPQTLVTAEFRFTDAYEEESLDGLWRINMTLEELNA